MGKPDAHKQTVTLMTSNAELPYFGPKNRVWQLNRSHDFRLFMLGQHCRYLKL
ncbi:hypothetical protein SHDE107825_17585 [Shewanella denitrificans]|jgi:hypothetical protein